MVSIDDVSKMKVSELREELKKQGLSSKGNKIELLSRLNIGIANKTPLLVNLTKKKQANMAGDHFSPGTHWVELECDGAFLEETTPAGFRYPTVPDGEVAEVQKRNF